MRRGGAQCAEGQGRAGAPVCGGGGPAVGAAAVKDAGRCPVRRCVSPFRGGVFAG